MNETTSSNEKISEALKLLNEAAREKREEFQTILSDKYEHLKDAIMDSEHSAEELFAKAKMKAANAYHHAKDYGAEKAKMVDEHVHHNPWPYIGGAAITGLLLGFILGRNRDK